MKAFPTFIVVFLVVASDNCSYGQNLQEELRFEYPQYAGAIDDLFQGNPQIISSVAEPATYENPYSLRLGIGHSIGEGVGNPASYTTIESLIPLWEQSGSGLVFLSPIVHIDNFGSPAVNIGLGARQVLDSETPSVFGISTWLDYRDSDAERGYYQVSLGLEYLTDWFEIRSNVYIPDIEDGRRELPNRFAGNSLLIERAEIALAGVDVEVGTVLPAVGGMQGRVALGYYHFDDPDVDAVTGWRVRGELAAHENLTAEAVASNDDVFGSTFVVRLTIHSLQDVINPIGNLQYPAIHSLRDGEGAHITNNVTDRLGERVRRNRFIVTGVDDGEAAVNPTTMLPYEFLFVSAGAAGDGAFETPYGTISDAMSDGRSGDAITYTPFGGTYAEDVVMTDGSKLFSNAVAHTLATQSAPVVLPFSGVGQQSTLASSIIGSVTVASNSELDGFAIDGGVVGTAVSNVVIERNSIQQNNFGLDGIFLSSLSNVAGSGIQISDNTIADGAANGISLSGSDVIASVTGNTANQTTMNGLLVQGTSFTGTVATNTFETGTGSGIRLDLTSEFHGAVEGNMVRNNGADGIALFVPVITDAAGTGNASVSGNDASGSDVGIMVFSSNPLLDITNNVADGTMTGGLISASMTFPGTVSGNQFNSGSNLGIQLVTFSEFTGNILNNTASNNSGRFGIGLDVVSMDGVISNNIANLNTGNGIEIFVQMNAESPPPGFSGTIANNTTDENSLNGLFLSGSTSFFEGSLSNNNAMSNTLSGIKYVGGVFQSNVDSNTSSLNGLNGIEIVADAFNGSLFLNTTEMNTAEGISIILNDFIAATSLVDVIGNQVSGNNINAISMLPESQFRLENTGLGFVTVEIDGNTSTDIVAAPEFNFNLLNTGAGTVTPIIVPPSSSTGTVGLNGVQIFP
jgi:hypothetical protein